MKTNSFIDKAGRALCDSSRAQDEDFLDLEETFDSFRASHLQPLSELTIELQGWLASFKDYLIAQRLKRKPQILRKLRRFSTRLTQLQDIGGCRIIVEKNSDVEKLLTLLREKVDDQKKFKLLRTTDYRQKGRDDSGYRGVHLIIEKNKVKLELQIRSRIQHYWAESIERTSVVYGHYLKEMEGDLDVLLYFKQLSDVFFEIESGKKILSPEKLKLEQARDNAEHIIRRSDKKEVLSGYLNEGVIRALVDKEKSMSKEKLHNWIIVFNWNQGTFVSWDVVTNDPTTAIAKYVFYEKSFSPEEGYEVVLIGASSVATVRETHSHYFGIQPGSSVLESLDQSIAGFSSKLDLDIGARQILDCLHRKRYWGKKSISSETLKNHYCKIVGFESSLEALIDRGLVLRAKTGSGVSLDLKKKKDIEDYL